MNWDFAWVADPSAWVGLGVLILLELALGIDNLLFISLLAGRLPRNSRKKAFRMGMGLALIQRFALLSMMAWLMGLREPLFTMLGRGFAVRDIILVAGGVFLLFKGSQELHDKLEDAGDHRENSGGGAGFWIVVIQIAALDAFFSFDSVLTAVGMANDVTMMMTAVAVAMAIMLRAASFLSAFVERYPSIVVKPHHGRHGTARAQGIPLRGGFVFPVCGGVQTAHGAEEAIATRHAGFARCAGGRRVASAEPGRTVLRRGSTGDGGSGGGCRKGRRLRKKGT